MIVRGMKAIDTGRIRIMLHAERERIRRRVERLIATECDGLGFSLG